MRHIKRIGGPLVVLLAAATAWAQVSTIAPDETVVFFPTFGWRVGDGRAWECLVHGWVHERGHRDGLAGLLIDRLGLGDEIDETARARFAERAVPFLVDNERGERIVIRVGERRFTLNPSAPNGHFFGRIRLPARDVEALTTATPPGTTTQPAGVWLPFQAVLPPGDARELVGHIMLIDEQGLSVIADIDDTLKVSAVADRRTLLRNTFLHPYEAVPGMPAALQNWAATGGVSFHYVSASPWQLYGPLADFFTSAGYPRGTFHLKPFRWMDQTFFDLFKSPEAYKPPVIESILARFPNRRFVLLGDAGEKDPEIYAAVARRHPERIVRIFIRDDGAPGADAERFQRVFADLPVDLWQVFRVADELPERLP